MDGWRRLKNNPQYQGGGGFGMDTGAVEFIARDPANYGAEPRRNDRDGGGLFGGFGI